ncbi:MAG TPA: chemotaxis protein CheD [Spirochaetota bacterium]|nr:chemotaxis protein CheD [Spirochaetota bacterium]
MLSEYKSKLNRTVVKIFAGEYYIGCNSEIIKTTIGGCIAVCIWCANGSYGGMNHYMLPYKMNRSDYFPEGHTLYGINAVRELVDNLRRVGDKISDYEAAIIGGSNIDLNDRSINNINMARLLLEEMDIRVIREDTGGSCIRKVSFDTYSGDIVIDKIDKTSQLVFV